MQYLTARWTNTVHVKRDLVVVFMTVGIINDNSFKELALSKKVLSGLFNGLIFCSYVGREVY